VFISLACLFCLLLHFNAFKLDLVWTILYRFSTGYTSVHGERPSSEYAKRRKESLETEFGQILGTYRSKTLFAYRRFGPFLALYRAAIISFQVAKLTVWHFFVQDIHRRAAKVFIFSVSMMINGCILSHRKCI